MRERKPTISHRLEYLGWSVMAALLRFLPRWAMVSLANAAGALLYDVFRVRRRAIDEHLAIAFGESHTPAQRRRIGRRTWQNAVLTFFEFIQPSPLFSPGWDTFPVREGVENAAPWFGGKAAIIVTGHIGNWEATGAILEGYGIQSSALAKPLHNPLVQERVLKERARYSTLEIILTQSSLKRVVDAARTGRWITFLADQDARRNGIFIDFFGRPASTATGPALFAYRLNLPILPIFCYRVNRPGRPLGMVFYPPIYPDPQAPREEEIRRLTEAHVRALEDVIRQHPEDYFWLHRRWKTKPKNQGSVTR